MDEIRFYELNCPHCDHQFGVKAFIQPGFSDHEDIDCPKCKTHVTNIRADMGYEFVEI